MKNNTRLISLLISGAIAVSSLTGCSDDNSPKFDVNSPERLNLAVEISLDANTQLINILNYKTEIKDGKCYIKFTGHYDNGLNTQHFHYNTIYTYIDHNDYIVTYEISKEDYKTIMTFNNVSTMKIKEIQTKEHIDFLQSIVDNYDPIKVEENVIEPQGKEHSY